MDISSIGGLTSALSQATTGNAASIVVLKKAMDMATELNLDAGAIKTIFEILITMSVQKQQELQGRNQG